MRSALSPRLSGQLWTVGSHHSLSANGEAATAQLEAFLKERLDNWDVEAAEVICTWGQVGDMCSPDYQSQLHKAHTTLQEARKEKERRKAETVTRVRQDAQEAARRRHRDRLAAEAQMRCEAKVKAAQRLQQRVEDEKRGKATSSAAPPLPTREVRRRSSVVGNTAAAAVDRPRKPADTTLRFHQATPPTTPRQTGRASAGGGTSNAAAAPTQATAHNTQNNSSSSSSSGEDSSTLSLPSDDEAPLSPTADAPSLGETFSGTFVVRRMLTARVHSTRALRHNILHHSPVKVAQASPTESTAAAAVAVAAAARVTSSPSPRKAPLALLPLPRRRRSSSKNAAGDTNTSLSLVDPSLPCEEDEVTAIFASRSRSQETAANYATPQRGRPSAGDVTANVTSPIRPTPRVDNLSSISSAGSYLRSGADNGEEGC